MYLSLLRRFLVLSFAAILIAITGVLSSGSPAEATSQIGPIYDFQLCAIGFPPPASDPPSDCVDTLGSGATGVDYSIWTEIQDPDYNFSSLVTFAPQNATIAAAAGMPTGAVVGKLRSSASLGLTGGPCGQGNTITDFILMNGSVDQSDSNLQFPEKNITAGSEGTLEFYRDDDDRDVSHRGTATGGSINSVADSGASFPTFAATDEVKIVTTTDGNPPEGEIRNRSANDGTSITVGTNFTAAVQAGDTYEVIRRGNEAGDTNKLPSHVDRYPSYLKSILDPDRVGDRNADGDEFDTIGGIAENPGATSGDRDGTVNAIAPHARYTGSITVSGTAVVLEFLVFAPGALGAFYGSPDKAGKALYDPGMYPNGLADFTNPKLGWASLTVLQDPTAETAPSAIEDFCTQLDSYTLLWGTSRDNPCTPAPGSCVNDDSPCIPAAPGCGNNGGINNPIAIDSDGDSTGACSGTDEAQCNRYTNGTTTNGVQGTGTHLYLGVATTQRDADNDGNENAVDTCAWRVNTGSDFRVNTTGGVAETPSGDKIDPVCDPAPLAGNDNSDGDFQPAGTKGPWRAGQDNCPLAANATQTESELFTPMSTAAPQGGPRTDSIGDACEGVVDANYNPSGLGSTTVANGHYHTFFRMVPKCIGAGGSDTDVDGWCNATETNLGSCSTNAPACDTVGFVGGTLAVNSTPEDYKVTYPMPIAQNSSGETGGNTGEPNERCNDTVDNDRDGLTDAADLGDGVVDGDADEGCNTTFSPPELGKGVDTDGDGWSDVSEAYIGTSRFEPCLANWPPDLVAGDIFGLGSHVNILDIGDFIDPFRYFDTSISQYPQGGKSQADAKRRDIMPGDPFGLGNDINILDLGGTVEISPAATMLQGTARVFDADCPFPP